MKKNFVKTIIMLAFIYIFSGCASTPTTTFNGNPRDAKDVATLTYSNGMLRPNLSVYKIDGKTPLVGFSYLSYVGNIKLNLQLLPGKHELEVCLLKTCEVKLLSYNFKAGSSYEFIYEDKQFTMVENVGDKQVPVDFQIRDIPEYKEPDLNEPYAVILEEGESAKEMFFGRWGATTEGGMIIFFRVDGLYEKYRSFEDIFFKYEAGYKRSIRLKPGIHEVEYYGMLGKKNTFNINSIRYNFESGKKYTIYLDEIKEIKDKTDKELNLAIVRVVEVK